MTNNDIQKQGLQHMNFIAQENLRNLKPVAEHLIQ